MSALKNKEDIRGPLFGVDNGESSERSYIEAVEEIKEIVTIFLDGFCREIKAKKELAKHIHELILK